MLTKQLKNPSVIAYIVLAVILLLEISIIVTSHYMRTSEILNEKTETYVLEEYVEARHNTFKLTLSNESGISTFYISPNCKKPIFPKIGESISIIEKEVQLSNFLMEDRIVTESNVYDMFCSKN